MDNNPHFFGFHDDPTCVCGVFFNGWKCLNPPLVVKDTQTFIMRDGSIIKSNIPFTYYKNPQGDASKPPASMRIYNQEEVIATLKKETVIELHCTTTGLDRIKLPVVYV